MMCVPDPKPPLEGLEEQRLIAVAQKGDRAAFAALIERYWDRIHRWLYHLTHDAHTAEDLAQETFLKALAGLGRFRVGTNFAAWLFRIAHNNLANQCRRTATRRREALPADLPDRRAGPAEQVLDREAMQDLSRAIYRLPPEFRAALLLRVEEEMSFRQIAEALDLTEETARWRVFKARQKLLTVLAARREQEKP
jgi:RNA polymerase sigma-70 factor (ECF subfamily)